MDVVVKVCTICVNTGKTAQALTRSAQDYEIRQGDRTATVTACVEHGAPFEEALPGRPGRKPATDPGPEIVGPAESAPAAKRAPAKKAAPAKKTVAKKTAAKKAPAKKAASGGRRPRKITTPEEIAQQSQGEQQQPVVVAV